MDISQTPDVFVQSLKPPVTSFFAQSYRKPLVTCSSRTQACLLDNIPVNQNKRAPPVTAVRPVMTPADSVVSSGIQRCQPHITRNFDSSVYRSSFAHRLCVLLADVADDDDDVSDQGRAQWVASQENIRRKGRGRGHRFRKRRILSRYAPGGVRSRRCGNCRGCLIEEDCAKCINCLDKPKFGGPNTKRQCCM